MAIGQISDFLQSLRRAALRRDEAGLTDGQLLDAFVRHREEAAFAALVQRHGPMVWGVCRRVLGNEGDAEDAFQATFLVLVRKAASVVPHEQIANWLYGVARQTAVKARAMAVKRKAREKQVRDLPEPAAREQASPDDVLALLDQELGRLPDKYRTAIVLCDLQGKSYKETARQLGCPEGTLAARLARGRALLAKRLARHGLTVTGGLLATVLSQSASAGVPASVVSSTIQAAGLFAAGTTAAMGMVSVNAIALTEGVLKTMLLSKLKIATAVLLVASTAAFTYGALAMRQQPVPPDVVKATSQTKPIELPKENKNSLQRKGRQVAQDTKDDASQLDGKWKVVALEDEGRKAPAEALKGMSWSFEGSVVQMFDPKPPSAKASMKLDWSKTPKEIDLSVLEGGGALKGKTTQGIFMLDKDRLVICLRDPKAAKKGRPQEFKTEAGSGLGMITLERDPPAKKGERKKNDLAAENILQNAGFEEGNTAPAHWSEGAAIEGVEYIWDKKNGKNGKACICLHKTAPEYFPIAQWYQVVDRKGDKSRLRVTAQVKAEAVTKAIIDVIFLDEQGEWIEHKWAAYIGAKKAKDDPVSHDWKEYTGQVNIPQSAKKIQIALQIYGPGKVWFDEVRAEYEADRPAKAEADGKEKDKQEKPLEGQTRNNDKIRSLLKERVEVLRKKADYMKRLREARLAGDDMVWQANLRVYKAELDLCETTEQRIAVLEKIAKGYKEIEDQLSQLKNRNASPEYNVLDAKLDRLEAELALEREKLKLVPALK